MVSLTTNYTNYANVIEEFGTQASKWVRMGFAWCYCERSEAIHNSSNSRLWSQNLIRSIREIRSFFSLRSLLSKIESLTVEDDPQHDRRANECRD